MIQNLINHDDGGAQDIDPAIGCTVCYQLKEDLLGSAIAYGLCESCDSPVCTLCLKMWAKQQLEGRYFKHLDQARVKCHQEKC
jgi:hypothetical protein